jgi:hypothetical protein
MKATKLRAEEVEAKIREYAGNLAHVARTLGVHRSTILRFVSKRPRLQEAQQEAREILIDNAESVVLSAVLNGDLSAAKYVLSTVGKTRGWCDLASDIEQLKVQLENLARQYDNGNARPHRTSA